MMQGWYYVESLTGQRHDTVQTESQIATVDSCFDLVGSLQYGVASCEVLHCAEKTFRLQSFASLCSTEIVTLSLLPIKLHSSTSRGSEVFGGGSGMNYPYLFLDISFNCSSQYFMIHQFIYFLHFCTFGPLTIYREIKCWSLQANTFST